MRRSKFRWHLLRNKRWLRPSFSQFSRHLPIDIPHLIGFQSDALVDESINSLLVQRSESFRAEKLHSKPRWKNAKLFPLLPFIRSRWRKNGKCLHLDSRWRKKRFPRDFLCRFSPLSMRYHIFYRWPEALNNNKAFLSRARKIFSRKNVNKARKSTLRETMLKVVCKQSGLTSFTHVHEIR